MKNSFKRFLSNIQILAIAYLISLTGCSEPSTDETAADISVTEKEIRMAGDSLLLHIDDIPDNIAVEKGTEFGAANRFTGANPSPDSAWYAIATSGAAHSAGWLVEVETKKMVPAAFQYGGSVTLGPWSRDGRFASFIEKGPAPIQTMSVVDIQALGTTVGATANQVSLSEHAEAVPPETQYEPIEWDGSELIFEVDGEAYRYDATAAKIKPQK